MAEECRIVFFVNKRKGFTHQHKITGAQILEKTDFVPVNEYRLIRDEGHHEITNFDEPIPVHEGEEFTAIFKGVTPTS